MAKRNMAFLSRTFLVFFLLVSMPKLWADSVGASLGVHGVAVDYTWNLSSTFDVRFSVSDMPFSDELEADGITYDLDYERTNLAVLVDVMPWQNGFHMTAGLFVLEHQWQIDAKLDGRYYIGESNYYADNLKLAGEITYAAASPYLGLGWKNIFGANSQWAMTVEAGILYVGEPSVDYGAAGKVCSTSPCTDTEGVNLLNDPNFQQSLAEEEEQLEEKLEDFEFWPVLQLGVKYTF